MVPTILHDPLAALDNVEQHECCELPLEVAAELNGEFTDHDGTAVRLLNLRI